MATSTRQALIGNISTNNGRQTTETRCFLRADDSFSASEAVYLRTQKDFRFSMSAAKCHPMIQFLAHALVLVAIWTVVIKYLFPMIFAAAYGEPMGRYIYWDLWPLAHLWLARVLLTQAPYQRYLAVAMSGLEIIIIGWFFYRFLSAPDWSIWRTNWFINKLFVLAVFVALFTFSLTKPGWFTTSKESA